METQNPVDVVQSGDIEVEAEFDGDTETVLVTFTSGFQFKVTVEGAVALYGVLADVIPEDRFP